MTTMRDFWLLVIALIIFGVAAAAWSWLAQTIVGSF